MNEVRVSGTDVITSALGFGCAGLMRVPSRQGRERLLREAHACGICHFDVARSYGLGAAEAELGKFAKTIRDRLVIATKFAIDLSASGRRFGAKQEIARRLVRLFPVLRRIARHGTSTMYAPRLKTRRRLGRVWKPACASLGQTMSTSSSCTSLASRTSKARTSSSSSRGRRRRG